MAKTRYRLHQETQIKDCVKTEPKTNEQIAKETNLNYFSVARVTKELTEQGILKIAGNIDRNRLYIYNTGKANESDKIPRYVDVLNKRNPKVIVALEALGSEDKMQAFKAVARIPTHVANLLFTATLASHGQDVRFRLDSIREAMQKDMLFIKNAANMLEQILNEARFWEPQYLAEMTDDPDYDYVSLQRAKDMIDKRDNHGN